MSNQEIINIGTLPNDGEGDPLRVAFGKINNNFSELFSTSTFTSNAFTVGTTVQSIFQYPLSEFTQGQFSIKSTDMSSGNSQSIILNAQLNSTKDDIKFTGFGSLFFGDPVTTYDMEVEGGNVKITCTPLVNATVFHFVSSKVLFRGEDIPGLAIELDGFQDSILATENNLTITTES